jgi:hypothetical protein
MRRLALHQRIILVGLVLGAVGACYCVFVLIREQSYVTLALTLTGGIAFNLGWFARAYCIRERRQSD